MDYCLPLEKAKKLLEAIREGKVTPEKLQSFKSSTERRDYLADIVGKENAKEMNALIESKFLLKDFKKGLVTAIKKATGLKPEIQKDMLSKVEKLTEVLDSKNREAFLEDLADKRLGVDVTFEEFQKLAELSKAVQDASTDISTKEKRIEYGNKILDVMDYVESLKPVYKNIVANVANIPKTLMSSLDFSAPLNQGWGFLSTPEFYKSLVPMFKYAFSEKSFRNLKADIISHPDYPRARKAGLRLSSLSTKLSQREEQFMSNLLNKIPIIGHIVKGSERAYVGFLNKLRFDSFSKLIRSAEFAGEDVGLHSRNIIDIANVVNDFSGSGNLGKNDQYANAVPILNATFFSPRKISATLNMFNPERYLNPNISPTARKAALRRLLGSVAITATIVGLFKLNGADVETDPRSSDSGMIKDGKTRFGITGGNKTYAVLLARLISNSSKSSKGKVTEFGKGYKPTTRADVMIRFGRNKLAPLASLVADWLYGSDAIGTPFNLGKESLDRVTSFTIQNVVDLYKEDPDNVIWGTLWGMFGGEVQTY